MNRSYSIITESTKDYRTELSNCCSGTLIVHFSCHRLLTFASEHLIGIGLLQSLILAIFCLSVCLSGSMCPPEKGWYHRCVFFFYCFYVVLLLEQLFILFLTCYAHARGRTAGSQYLMHSQSTLSRLLKQSWERASMCSIVEVSNPSDVSDNYHQTVQVLYASACISKFKEHLMSSYSTVNAMTQKFIQIHAIIII